MSTANESYRYDQICTLRTLCGGGDSRLTAKDQTFGASLCDQYFSRLWLSDTQWYWVGKLLRRGGALPAEEKNETYQEIFDGKKIKALFAEASRHLKFPRLRYQTSTGSKVIFSYAADTTSNWCGCTFIDNGGKENKKRYSFIDRNGGGRINRDAPPEIKTLILQVAKNPTETAKLQGQKYTYCCFCGLELTNGSSVYHGYGPICAGNWGLPWGETGDLADEQEAAAAELAHQQLVDIK